MGIGLGGGGGGAGEQGAPGSNAGTWVQFSVVTSEVPSAAFANGVRYVPLSPTVEYYIQVEGTAPTTGNLTFTVGYQMSAANAGDIRLRVDKRVASDAAANDTALDTGTAFTVTPGNDVVRHRITSSSDSSMTIAVTAGDLVVFKLIRVAADGADTHTGDMRCVDVSARVL